MKTIYSNTNIAAVILAGGEGRRMLGANKPMCKLGDQSLLAHVTNRLRPQVSHLLLSANDEQTQSVDQTIELVKDHQTKRLGPLAGLHSAMQQLQLTEKNTTWLLSSPVDCPFIPMDLAERLWQAVELKRANMAYAHYEGRDHYLCALWSTSLLPKLSDALNNNQLAVRHLIKELNGIAVDFSNSAIVNPFFNINTPEELEQANQLLNHCI